MGKMKGGHAARSDDAATQLYNFALANCLWHAFDDETVRTEQWLEHSRPMPDEGCEGLYSSPDLLDAIKPYAGVVKQ